MGTTSGLVPLFLRYTLVKDKPFVPGLANPYFKFLSSILKDDDPMAHPIFQFLNKDRLYSMMQLAVYRRHQVLYVK